MANNKLHLRIVTPVKLLYENDVDMVIVRGMEGDVGILPGRQAISMALGYGPLRIEADGEELEAAVLGGIAEVKSNQVIVLSEAAEWSSEIDVIRAQAARERADHRLLHIAEGVDARRAELALRRALVRIEVSSAPIIKGRH